MKQRWALVVMGAWLTGTIVFAIVAAENFYTIDRLLASRTNPSFAAAVDRMGQASARDLLRYLSSELNRLYFQLWNWTQLGFGVLALWLVGDRGRTRIPGLTAARGPSPTAAIIAMLAIVGLMIVWLTPAIVTLGRSLDFVPREPSPPGMQRFWVLHATYTTLEMIELLIGAVVTARIVREAPASARADDLRARERALEVQRLEP